MSVHRLTPLLAAALLACQATTPAALVSVQPVDGGASCPDGGVQIQTGLDDDGDGLLDDDEIDDSSTVCDGAPGDEGEPGDDGDDGDDAPEAIVRVDHLDPDPSGPCEFGGVAVHAGLDDGAGALAGDGVLDDTEIDDTEYVCNGADGGDVLPETIIGDITIHNSLDVALLAKTKEITGRLQLSTDAITELSLPVLERVAELQINGTQLATLSMPALETAGAVVLSNNEHLDTIELPGLTSVGDLNLSSNPAMVDYGGFEALEEVTGSLYLTDTPPSATGFRSLGSVGTLHIEYAGFESLAGFGSIATLGNLELSNSDDLESLDGLEVAEIGGSVRITDTHGLDDVSALADLDAIGGDFTVLGATSLSPCDARAVVAAIGRPNIGGSVVIQENEVSLDPCPCQSETPATSFTPALVGISAIAFDGQCLWALTPADHTLYRLDFTGTVIDTVVAPNGAQGLAVADGSLWVSASAAFAYRLDWNGNLMESLPIPIAAPAFLGGDSRYLVAVWPGADQYSYIDFTTDPISQDVRDVPIANVAAFAPTNDSGSWMADTSGTVRMVNVTPGGFMNSTVTPTGIPTAGLAFDGNGFWFLKPDGAIQRFP